jgi:putative ABC transport system permease protein
MRKYGWKVGERVALQSRMKRADGTGDWTFQILGTWVNSEKENLDESQLLIAHYRYVNESLPIGPTRDTVNAAILRVDNPARAPQVQAAVDARYKNSSNETLTESEQVLEETRLMSLGDLDAVAHRIVGATFFVLLFATGALMMQSIRERTPELAVLKTLGFSDRRVMVLILAETLVLCLAGAAIGLWIGMRLLPMASESIGTVEVPPNLFVLGFACAVALALAGGGVAAWRGLRLRVADALANR